MSSRDRPARLDAALMARLERLQIRALRARGGAGGTRSRQLGAGVDFADHRPYTPGDDLRYVDWTLYGRSGRMMLRLSEVEARKPVHLLVDRSGSMEVDVGRSGADRKSDLAREVAAALSYVALCAGDPLKVWPYAGDLGRPLQTGRRRSEVLRIWRHLAEASPPPGSDLRRAAERLAVAAPRRGVVIVISDLLDDGWQAGVQRLRHEGFEVALVHLQGPGERALPIRERRFDLIDAETGEALRGLGRAELEALRADPWAAQIRAWCRRNGAPLVSVTAAAPTPLLSLLPLFRAGGVLSR